MRDQPQESFEMSKHSSLFKCFLVWRAPGCPQASPQMHESSSKDLEDPKDHSPSPQPKNSRPSPGQWGKHYSSLVLSSLIGSSHFEPDHSIPLTLGAPAQRMHNLELAWGRSPWMLHLHSINEMKNPLESTVCKNSLQTIRFSCHSVLSESLWPHEPQHARPPCPSPTPGVYPNSCPLSQWCHPTISSCHPLLLPPSIFPSIRLFFKWLCSLHQVAKVLEFHLQYQSF